MFARLRTLAKVSFAGFRAARIYGRAVNLEKAGRNEEAFRLIGQALASLPDTIETGDYLGPVGRTATFTLRDRDGRTVASAVGKLQGDVPLSLEPHGDTGPIPYPHYQIITVDGVTEVIEHRRMEPTFYLKDDPQVKQKLGIR